MLDQNALEAANNAWVKARLETNPVSVSLKAAITAYLAAARPAVTDKIASTIGYYLASVVSGNNQPCMSGDPRDRIQPARRRHFDQACHAAAEAVLAALGLTPTPVAAEPVAWQPIETAPREQEVLIAYWRWRSSMSPGSIIVQSARQVEYHGSEIWSWVVEDNKHGPFPIRGWCDGDMIGWQPLPAASSVQSPSKA